MSTLIAPSSPTLADPLNSFLEWAIQPILEAVLASGASAVRVILLSNAQPQEAPLCFALGSARDLYKHLDESLLNLAYKEDHLVLNDMNQVRDLDIPEDLPHPGALMAVALTHENNY